MIPLLRWEVGSIKMVHAWRLLDLTGFQEAFRVFATDLVITPVKTQVTR